MVILEALQCEFSFCYAPQKKIIFCLKRLPPLMSMSLSNNDKACSRVFASNAAEERRLKISQLRYRSINGQLAFRHLPLLPLERTEPSQPPTAEQQQQAQPTPPTALASASAASPKPLSESVVLSETLLGAGAFGAVYLGIHEETGEMIAVKKVTLGPPCDATAKQIEQLAGEIRLMKALDHPNVVKYLHAQRKDTDLYIYMEYLSGGSLASVLSKFQTLGEKVVRIYMRQVLEGLKYLHQKNIVHRDIKPDNILLTPQGTAKISDFGTSREFSDGKNLLTVTGTAWFMAPEVVKGTGHGAPADLWSVGCTIIQLLTGTVPFGEYDNAVTAMFNIAMHPEKVQEAIPDNISPELRSLLRGCLMEEPHARLTAVQALAHPFFAGADNDPIPVVHSVVQPLPGKYRVPPVRNAEGDVPTPTPLNVASKAPRVGSVMPPSPKSSSSFATKLRDTTQNEQLHEGGK